MDFELECVRDFHEKMGQPFGDLPQLIGKDRLKLRYKLISEELEEYKEAAESGKITDISKELCDLLYVVLGTMIEHGLADVLENLFDAVHESNMTKLSPDGSVNFNEFGKVIKPPTYSPVTDKQLLAILFPKEKNIG
jgi:predicted HAD superfamily Cof-like phosphohydrolase